MRRPLEPEQYTLIRYADRLTDAGALPSISGTGDSYDHALAGSVMGLFKAELVRWDGPGAAWTTSSSPSWAGSTGSTTPDCTQP